MTACDPASVADRDAVQCGLNLEKLATMCDLASVADRDAVQCGLNSEKLSNARDARIFLLPRVTGFT